MPPKRNRPVDGTPPNKKTKDKPELESGETNTCISCDKLHVIEDNGALYEFCYQWEYHAWVCKHMIHIR